MNLGLPASAQGQSLANIAQGNIRQDYTIGLSYTGNSCLEMPQVTG